MIDPKQRQALVQELALKMSVEGRVSFLNEVIDTIASLDDRMQLDSFVAEMAMKSLSKERKVNIALNETVKAYGETIDKLCSDNDDLERALAAAQDVICSLQRLSGTSLLYSQPSQMVN